MGFDYEKILSMAIVLGIVCAVIYWNRESFFGI